MDDAKTYPVGHKEYTCKNCGKKTNLVCAFTGNCIECKELIDIIEEVRTRKMYPASSSDIAKAVLKWHENRCKIMRDSWYIG